MRTFICLVALCLAPLTASAWEAIGVGGGGWLYATEYNATNPNEVLIGSDMAGIHRSTNGGLTWTPWNTGFITDPSRGNSYVQDIQAVNYDGFNGYYAATIGGLFKAPTGGSWSEDTPLADYWFDWRNDNELSAPVFTDVSMPFGCIDWNGSNLLVAGAGHNRWNGDAYTNSSNSWTAYPGLGAPHSTFLDGSTYPHQYTVWTKDLDGTAGWQPLVDAAGLGEFGTARDVTVACLDSVNHVVCTTENGIYHYDGTAWHELHTGEFVLYLDENSQVHWLNNTVNDWYGYGANAVLAGWSVHLTTRGTLYIGMEATADATPEYPSGLYRINDLTDPLYHVYLSYCDDTSALDSGLTGALYPVAGVTAGQLGRTYRHQIYISVVDGTDTDPDIVYTGGRSGALSLVRTVVNHTNALFVGANRCVVYHDLVTGSKLNWNFDASGQAQVLDVGYQNYWGTNVIHRPGICPTDPDRMVLQFNGMLHRTDDGQTMENVCNNVVASGYATQGYNEICVFDSDFTDDGRLLNATGDNGGFVSVDPSHVGSLVRFEIPIDGTDPDQDHTWNRQSCGIDSRLDWLGSGDDAFFVLAGNKYSQRGRVMMQHPDVNGGAWVGISPWDSPSEHYLRDLVLPDDRTLHVAYKIKNGAAGVKSAAYDTTTGSWNWSENSTGLTGEAWRLLDVPATGRLFCATTGGVFLLQNGVWVRALNGTMANRSFTGLWAADDGQTLYATSRSWMGGGTPGIYKCTNAGAAPASMVWTSIALPVELDTWDLDIADITVNPYNEDNLYMAVDGAFGTWRGVWQLVPISGGTSHWIYALSGSPWEGIGVSRLVWGPPGTKATYLYAATNGYETLRQRVYADVPEIGTLQMAPARFAGATTEGGLTRIHFTLRDAGAVKLDIYDLRGRIVRSLGVDGCAAGPQTIVWDGRDVASRQVGSGVYLMKLMTNSGSVTGKIAHVR